MVTQAVLAAMHFAHEVDDWEGLPALGRTWAAWKTTFRSAHLKLQRQILASGDGEPLGGAHGVLPTNPPAMLDHLKIALDNLALAVTNDTAVLQQLMAANLPLTKSVAALTATNKKLVDAAATRVPATPPGTGRGGMANVVYCSSNDLYKNNYYSALAPPSSCNPTHLPSYHTGIADSGASSFYFWSSAPVANLNQEAPTVCVRVANGLPERLVASATLALVPSLPPAAMKGHIMPSFLHTLIGLGPFVDLGYTITFTKTGVLVVDPDGRCVLKGWRATNGPRLWHFPLTAAKPSPPAPVASHGMHGALIPRASAADSAQPTPATPSTAVTPSPSVPPPGSSRGLLATLKKGRA